MMPQRLEHFADGNEVVDLAIENHDEPAILRHHWLVPTTGEIENRKPCMSQPDAGIVNPHTAVVGSAVINGSNSPP